MLGPPALSVSVESGRCLIYGDGITVNRLLPSWEWVSSPSPGTALVLDKVVLKLRYSEYLSPWVPAPSASHAPGFTKHSADTAAPSWISRLHTVKKKRKEKKFFYVNYAVRTQELGNGEEGYEILYFGHDMTSALMNSQHAWLHV